MPGRKIEAESEVVSVVDRTSPDGAVARGVVSPASSRNGAAYVSAMRRRFAPEDLPEMIAEAYRSAYLVGDARTMLECAKVIMSYTAGKPANADNGRESGANALQSALAAWLSAKAEAEHTANAAHRGPGIDTGAQDQHAARSIDT